VLQIVIYLSIAILLGGTIYKTVKISRMPIHLRWDLYPIPHEKGKAHYGGSYYEESNWWTKPVHTSLSAEIMEISKEILGIKSLYRNNRKLWYFSYPFHIGLYLLTALLAFLFLSAISNLSGVVISANAPNIFGRAIYYTTIIVGVPGWILGLLGAAGLLIMRLSKSDYRRYSTKSDYFSLILLIALLASGLYAWFSVDRSFAILRDFTHSLLMAKSIGVLPAAVQLELILVAFFFTYLPFTHMTHFVGKFFTYHRVRWQDKPNIAGGKIESEVAHALDGKVGWQAKHMRHGKSWRDGAVGGENQTS